VRHHRLPFVQAAEDGGQRPVGFPDTDLAQFVLTRAALHEDKGAALIALQRPPPAPPTDRAAPSENSRIVANISGLSRPSGFGSSSPQLHRARHGIQHISDVRHRALERFLGVGVDPAPPPGIPPDAWTEWTNEISFSGNVGLRIQTSERSAITNSFSDGLDDFATRQIAPDDATGERRHDRHNRPNLTTPVEAAQFLGAHAEQLQSIPRLIRLGLDAQQFRMSTLQFRFSDHLFLQQELSPGQRLAPRRAVSPEPSDRPTARGPIHCCIENRQRSIRLDFLAEVRRTRPRLAHEPTS
jgi:hypothetical protein